MLITNKLDLPEGLYNATARQRKPQLTTLSATEIIKPPQIRVLEMRHWDEIEEDASERIWMVIGSGIHYFLEQASKNSFAEESLRMPVLLGGEEYTLTGMPDLLDANDILWDYKITSVWSHVFGMKDEWIAQLNVYRAMYEHHGFSPNKLMGCNIYRDWSKKNVGSKNYPSHPVATMECELWSLGTAAAFIHDRMLLHITNYGRPESELTPCTAEERWYRPGKFAVMKEGRKSALRVFDTEEESDKWLADNPTPKTEIVERPGTSNRCWDYCHVNKWCHQFRNVIAKEEGDNAE